MAARRGCAPGRRAASEGNACDATLGTIVSDLLRWAHGLLPARGRRQKDTGDLVQGVVAEAIERFDRNPEWSEAQRRSYLQTADRHRIVDELRRAEQVETAVDDRLLGSVPAGGPSPLDSAIAAEERRRYWRALHSLPEDDQLLLVGRVDLELSYRRLALVTGRSNPDAARMATRRAALRLAREIGRDLGARAKSESRDSNG
jgi:RNA polymerase sigma factor (sigma-70 family)